MIGIKRLDNGWVVEVYVGGKDGVLFDRSNFYADRGDLLKYLAVIMAKIDKSRG